MNGLESFATFSKVCLLVLLLKSVTGCTDNAESENVTYIILNKSLSNSAAAIDQYNSNVMHLLINKTHDWETKAYAEKWYPKAVTVNTTTNNLCDYIIKLKTQLELESGIRIKDGKKIYDNMDETVVDKFNKKGFFNELEQRLIIFKDSVSNINTELSKVLDDISVFDFMRDTTLHKDFYSHFFKDKPGLAAIAILTSFENNAKQIESIALDFCNRKCPEGGDYYEMYSAIASQSSTYVQKGEIIEINAGVGAFSIKEEPNIVINGKHIDINSDGVAIYKFKSSSKPGKHYVPVSIEFIKPDGQKIKVEKKIEYTVAE